MEQKKTVVLGVTGGIAAYKTASLASMLVKNGYDVQVLLTRNATNFINPIVFETLTKHKCLIDTFDRNFEYSVEHYGCRMQGNMDNVRSGTEGPFVFRSDFCDERFIFIDRCHDDDTDRSCEDDGNAAGSRESDFPYMA